MSDYKEVEMQVEVTQEHILIQALEAVIGGSVAQGVSAQVEQGVVATNIWRHNRTVDLCIRENQLPEHLHGFGDLGIMRKGGKYVFTSISEGDAGIVDSGKSQERGTFINDIRGYQQEIENAYAVFEAKEALESRVPGISIETPQGIGDSEDVRAWGARLSVPASVLARLGVQVIA